MKKRHLAFMIDFFVAAFIQSAGSFINIILSQSKPASGSYSILYGSLMGTLISLLYLIFRDVLGTRSIGKRVMKLKIVNEKDGKATFIQRLIRNIPFFLGPVEIFVFFMNNERRLGDIISKTKVVEMN